MVTTCNILTNNNIILAASDWPVTTCLSLVLWTRYIIVIFRYHVISPLQSRHSTNMQIESVANLRIEVYYIYIYILYIDVTFILILLLTVTTLYAEEMSWLWYLRSRLWWNGNWYYVNDFSWWNVNYSAFSVCILGERNLPSNWASTSPNIILC